MSQIIADCIKYLFDNYAQAQKEPFEKHPVADYIRSTIPNSIMGLGLIDPTNYEVNASPGMSGKWAFVPWIRISNKSISKSAQEGVYIVYLFSADGDSVFLTLNQGYTDIEKDTKQQENSTKKTATTELLRARAANCIDLLDPHSFNSDTNISLGKEPGKRGKMYEQGTIFYKEYKKQDIPSEDVLEKDLKDMLEIYEEYYNKIFLKNHQAATSKSSSSTPETSHKDTMQKIFFGAPGTGKSYKIDYNLFKDKDGKLIGKGIKDIPEDRKFRTTFHPDYDYAQFVGAYKPQKVQYDDNGLFSEEQLAQKLSDSFPKAEDDEIKKTTAIALFGLQYASSLNGKNISKIVKLAGIGEERYKRAYLSAIANAYTQLPHIKNEITYSFVPQVFTKAYVAAWKQYFGAGKTSTTTNQIYLVIEEINRGNCAQIFGDIFQLLDRVHDGSNKGFSQYSIDADCDFANFIENELTTAGKWYDYKTVVGEGKLKLPPNLNILATMNTSDQSLYPMDSAFKRRFDWEYVPISFESKDAANYQIDIDGSKYPWKNFVETVNEKILELTESEDKQLGEYFIKPDKKDENGEYVVISCERFLGKVMFYLWNEVCKDEHKNGSFFRVKSDSKEDFFTFQDLYKKQGLLKQFMEELQKKE